MSAPAASEEELLSGASGFSNDAQLLKMALLNEKAAPEILPYEQDLIGRIETAIDYQEEQIELIKESADFELLRTIYTTELARVRYLLRAYLRTRLHKVETYAMHILDNADIKSRLSEKEDAYAQDYFVLLGSHMKAAVGDHLPAAFNSLVRQASAHPDKDMVPAPDLDTHVFASVRTDCGHVPVDDEGNVAEFRAGDLFVVRYAPVAGLVAEGAVHLT